MLHENTDPYDQLADALTEHRPDDPYLGDPARWPGWTDLPCEWVLGPDPDPDRWPDRDGDWELPEYEPAEEYQVRDDSDEYPALEPDMTPEDLDAWVRANEPIPEEIPRFFGHHGCEWEITDNLPPVD
jgi:hypothetical protein